MRIRKELDKEKVSTLYKSGKTTEQIGKIYGVTGVTIGNFMREHNIKARRSRRFLTVIDKEKLSNMRDSGMTLKQIADAFNVGLTCIHNNLKNHKEEIEQSDIVVDKNTGYNFLQFERIHTKISDELNLYIPEKWRI